MLGLLPSKSIKVTYNLNPPLSIPVPADLPKNNTRSYPVAISAASTTDKIDTLKAEKAFYRGLRKSLDAARNEIGEELTTWRDLVGKAELNKEPKKGDDDEEGGEGGASEEGQT